MSPADRRRRRGRTMLLVALLALLGAVLASFAVGPLRLPPLEVMQALAVKLGLLDPQAVSSRDLAVVWQLRIPRALLGAMVGASLAMAGASLQGLFGNPLADPGIVGVSQGAALGAVAAIVLGAAGAAGWLVPVAAFAGGALAIGLTYALARPGKGSGNATLLLVGIAMAAFCSALIGFLTYIASESELQSLVFWQMGSLARANWADVAAVVPLFAIGVFALQRLATPLDMLALGERQAQHLGLDVTRTRRRLVAFSALLVGAAVAFAGSISFVGLVVPHVARLLVGPGHRWLLPLSGLLGALLIVVADTAARTLDPPAEIPLGLFSAALGAPFFLWLVLQQRRRRRHERTAEAARGGGAPPAARDPAWHLAGVRAGYRDCAGWPERRRQVHVAGGSGRRPARRCGRGEPVGQTAGQLQGRAAGAERAVMPQEHGVRFAFSVEEVVAMGRLPHPPDPVTDDARVEAAIDAAELQALRLREVQQLSGGESARTTFARVLAQDTPLLLLDEPTAALDLRHQERTLRSVRASAEAGACVIVVVHDLNLAAGYADRIVLLEQGRVAADGTPLQVLTEDNLQRVYQQDVVVLEHPRRGVPLVVVT